MVDVTKQKLNAVVEHVIRLDYPTAILDETEKCVEGGSPQIVASGNTIRGQITHLLKSNSILKAEAQAILDEVDKIDDGFEELMKTLHNFVKTSNKDVIYQQTKLLENLRNMPGYDPSKAEEHARKCVESQKQKFLKKESNQKLTTTFQQAGEV
jgi:ElaB/YqjD/DUF883 family membrane-anchored ribosome-binding protein